MKRLGRILARYVLSAAGVALLLVMLNVMIGMSFIVSSFETEPSYGRTLGALARSVVRTADGFAAEGGTVLDGDYCWAMLLSDNGDILWSEALPDELNRHYTVPEVASFSRWYLDDYPVRVWRHEDGLFVIAQPKHSVWKHQMMSSAASVDLLLHKTIPAFFVLNIGAALLLALLFGWRLFRSVRPVAQGIADLAEKKPVELSEKGMLGALCGDLNRASDQLQRQETLLRKRDRTRTEWIAGVSHDIRTPLTLVLGGAAQLEEDQTLPAAAREKAGVIRVQGERIRSLVSDLNLASKLEYELQPLRIQAFRPAEILRAAAADTLNSGVDERYTIEMELPPTCESIRLEGDAPLIERAVRNLVNNSIRHNPQGCTITLGLSEEAGFCRLTVADTGGGFPRAVLERMRAPQEGALHSHGLGLTIVRQIMAAHGGTAHFENTETGTRVTLTLPKPNKGGCQHGQ